jgi:hypothetical protein
MYLQATSKNIIMTFSCTPIIPTPEPIKGFSVENILELDDVESVGYEVGLDGISNVYVKPVIVKGKITLLPGSTGVAVFRKVQEYQVNTGLVIAGSLFVGLPSMLTGQTFNEFVITSAFKGFEAGDKVKDVVFSFTAQVPEAISVGNIANLALSGLALV